MAGELGKASLDLEANLGPFARNVQAAEGLSTKLRGSLEAVAAVSKVAERELHRVKASPTQATQSTAILDVIGRSVGRVSADAIEAANHLDRVKLTAAQATETEVSGGLISRMLRRITGDANEARRAIASVKIAGGVPGRSGVGVGPFGSGFGRVGLLGTGIAGAALTAPAAAPAAAGLLAGIPALASIGVGALATLVLAFKGVGKAIDGDKKAYDALTQSQQRFVITVRSLHGWLQKLKETAGSRLFPGLTAGLTAALSPGTVGAITRAVSEFGSAIGQAGAAWGRYFGSAEFQSIFGPLMQAGARNLTVLSSAALSLFDALGVLGRAAIPFTNWLTLAADKGAKLADSWLHAKDASGGLAHTMDQAQVSLRLVGGLLTSLGRVVYALGAALYPVSKVAVKDLTDGLNALARIIEHNRAGIQEIVGGALSAFVSMVRTLTPVVTTLAHGLNDVVHAIGGWHTAFEIILSGFLISKMFALGAGILGVGASATAARAAVGLLATSIAGIPTAAIVIPIVLDIVYRKQVSQAISAAATAALNAAGVNTKRGSAPTYDQWKKSKGAARLAIDSWLTANGFTPGELVGAPASTSSAAADAAAKAAHGKGSLPTPFKEPGTATPYLSYLLSKAASTETLSDDRSVIGRIIATLKGRLSKASSIDTKTQIQNTINSYADQLKSMTDTPFGTPPPFDKNLGPKGRKSKPPVIPPLASRAEALASANANRASLLGNVGETAKRYLEAELADLKVAAAAIAAKYKTATGKARTQLFAALTRDQNRIRTVRQQISLALKKDKLEQLQFALDVAKLAVEQAKEGTPAYDKAVKAEAALLRQEIAYFDKRRRNLKLSQKARQEAVQGELAAVAELKSLLPPATVAQAGADERQFLTSFQQIVSGFAPNAKPAAGRDDTRMYELVFETRQTNEHLKDLKKTNTFPGSGFAVASAEAAVG